MRFRPFGLLLSGVVVASSGCSMDATAPSTLAPAPTAARVTAALGEGSSNDVDGRSWPSVPGDLSVTAAYAVTIDPQRPNLLRFGPFTLELPANSVCNRDSGYGLDVFDLDCKTAKDPIRITALVRSLDGGIPRIDLMPEMRFNPKRVVTLTLSLADAPMPASSPRILYCATLSTTACVDEAELDPTLVTQMDAATRTVFRRIKHFSGYFVEW